MKRPAEYPQRVILLDDPDFDEDGYFVEFRLTYEGPLLSTRNDPRQPGQTFRPTKRDNRYAIRCEFHRQLTRLWSITPHLDAGERSGPDVLLLEGGPDTVPYDRDTLAARHAHYGFNFVPLVTEDNDLLCGLEILFLRPDRPGSVIWRGDIDNRLKTLIDSLKIPGANEEYSKRTPTDEETPTYVLLEDDSLITKIAVETDQLLTEPETSDKVKLIITVRVRPREPTLNNLSFS